MVLQGGHKLVHISILQGDDKAGPEAQLKSKANNKTCTYIDNNQITKYKCQMLINWNTLSQGDDKAGPEAQLKAKANNI